MLKPFWVDFSVTLISRGRRNKAISISILLIVSEIVIIFRASFIFLFIHWTYGGELLDEVDVTNRAPGCKLKAL